jgi:hypothetical protein
MDVVDWLGNLTVTQFQEKVILVLVTAVATWAVTRVNSRSQQERERKAKEAEARKVFERDALVAVQDVLDDLYRVVEDLVLERFPPDSDVQYLDVPVEPAEYRKAEAKVRTLQERVLDVGIRALVERIVEVAGDLVRSGSRVTVHDQGKLLVDLSTEVHRKIGSRPRSGKRTNRGRKEVRLDAGAALHGDLLHDRVQQPLELLRGGVGDRLLDLTPQRGQVRVGGQRRLGVALGHQAGPAGLQRTDLLLQRADTVPAGRLRQPPRLKGPQVAVDGGAPLCQRLVHAGKLRAAARVGGLPCLAGAGGGLLEDDPVLEGGQDLGEDASSSGSAGMRCWSQRLVPCRWRAKQV